MPKTKLTKLKKTNSNIQDVFLRTLKRLFKITILSAIIWFFLGILVLLTLLYFVKKGAPKEKNYINPFAEINQPLQP